jgi:bisphosphoglycerate-independent phosphoglycerate mutase (AlkP superfamily)
MSYGQDFLPPEGAVERVPGGIEHIRRHLDQPRMQAVVALAVLGGFGVAVAGVKAITTEARTPEEREAARNVPKFLGLSALVYGTFYLLDVDKRWWRMETASREIEKWIEQRL